MADEWVKKTQQWVNSTYGGVRGYVPCAEDGYTGWQTVDSLLMGLQHELGMADLVANFGPGTTAEVDRIGPIRPHSPGNVVKIVQCALYCKGYDGAALSGDWDDRTVAAVKSVERDAGIPQTGTVSTKLLRGLLSMDAYVLVSRGSAQVRSIQQWLNGTYLAHAGFDLSPCDGVYTRGVQQAYMKSIQYELGISDANATGNFGDGTKAGLRSTNAQVKVGSVDGTHHFVRLFKAGLIFNGYPAVFDGRFDQADQQTTNVFQSFAALPPGDRTGAANYRTWASLLVSCGDPDRPADAADMATRLDAAKAQSLHDAGYRTVGRYLTVEGKRFGPGELDTIFAAGLNVFPIFQEAGTELAHFSAALGYDNGYQAVRRARQLGFAAGTTIFFSIDFDATDDQITSHVIPHFEGIKKAVDASINHPYQIGIYATRNVCARVSDLGLASVSFVSGMSWGYSGNLGFRLPANWAYDQFANTQVGGFEIDKDLMSSRAHPASRAQVAPSPVLRYEGSAHHDEGFFWHIVEMCYQADIAANGSRLIGDRAVADIVLQWLQKEKYWTSNFQLYSPLPETILGTAGTPYGFALGEARDRFAKQSHTRPERAHYPGDIPHMAVTIRGYTTWGAPTDLGAAHAGDLGGWALDLVTCWVEYARARRSSSPYTNGVASWIRERVGGSTGSFGAADLVADVDGYLIGSRLLGPQSASLSEALRQVLVDSMKDPQWRYREFRTHRFGTRANILSAVRNLFSPFSITVFPVNHFLTDRWPGEKDDHVAIPQHELDGEVGQLANGFADVLAKYAGLPNES